MAGNLTGSLSENWWERGVPASWDRRYRHWAHDVVTSSRPSPHPMGTLQALAVAIFAAVLFWTVLFVISWLFALSPGFGLIGAAASLTLYAAWIRAVVRSVG
jgi:hypothetical protein